MTRTCEHCGTSFVAQRSTARFCSSTCRTTAWKAQGASSVPKRSHGAIDAPGFPWHRLGEYKRRTPALRWPDREKRP
jgi:endogenous inhibitor of DNA gyrase (YacG/DUF329 family)